MSHFTKVATHMCDKEAIENALSSMGLKLSDRAPCRAYSGSPYKDNVVKLPGAYDFALVEDADGIFSIDADFWGGHVENVIGAGGSILIHQYAIEKLKLEAAKKKYRCVPTQENAKESKFLIFDPMDSTAKLEATVSNSGEVTFKAIGFKGSGCMKFESLENALGKAQRKLTADYYEPEEKERVRVSE